MNAIRVPAKINWGLRVLGRRTDGFHELRSWFVTAEWCDAVSMAQRTTQDDRLSVTGPRAAGVPAGDDNLVLRAATAWRAAGGRAPAQRFLLDKHLPHGAGLGGGSGDAAAALHLLQSVGAPLSAERLLAVALEVGSDVPFYLGDAAASLRTGRGEGEAACATPPRLWLAFAVPDVSVSTAAVFAALDAPAWPGESSHEEPSLRAAPGFPRVPPPNDLEEAAERAAPELARFRAALLRQGRFHMSGSGGVHYAVCGSEDEASALCARVAGMCEDVRVAAVRRTPPLHP